MKPSHQEAALRIEKSEMHQASRHLKINFEMRTSIFLSISDRMIDSGFNSG